MKNFASFIFGCAISLCASAATDTNRTIESVGAQNGNGYFTVSPNPSGGCLYNVLYVQDLGTTMGKSLYAAILTAYSSGKILARVDYTPNGSGVCYISLVQF